MAIKKLSARFCFLFFLLAFATPAHAENWRKIDDGLFYLHLPEAHAFKMDPHKFKFQILASKISFPSNATVQQLAKKFKPVLVINGGFFSTEGKSLGWLVNNGTRLNGPHATSWSAVFQIQEKIPGILLSPDFKPRHNIEMAIQAGPRLVIRGHIPNLKFSLARRSGIGLQPDGHVVIAIADEGELSLSAFANLFRKSERQGGLGCSDALNLDGGGSSQLVARWKDLDVDIAGDAKIPNAIAVFPRAQQKN